MKTGLGVLKYAFFRVSSPFGIFLMLVSCGPGGGDETILLNVLESTVRENKELEDSIKDLKEENRRLKEQNESLWNRQDPSSEIMTDHESDPTSDGKTP